MCIRCREYSPHSNPRTRPHPSTRSQGEIRKRCVPLVGASGTPDLPPLPAHTTLFAGNKKVGKTISGPTGSGYALAMLRLSAFQSGGDCLLSCERGQEAVAKAYKPDWWSDRVNGSES